MLRYPSMIYSTFYGIMMAVHASGFRSIAVSLFCQDFCESTEVIFQVAPGYRETEYKKNLLMHVWWSNCLSVLEARYPFLELLCFYNQVWFIQRSAHGTFDYRFEWSLLWYTWTLLAVWQIVKIFGNSRLPSPISQSGDTFFVVKAGEVAFTLDPVVDYTWVLY